MQKKPRIVYKRYLHAVFGCRLFSFIEILDKSLDNLLQALVVIYLNMNSEWPKLAHGLPHRFQCFEC